MTAQFPQYPQQMPQFPPQQFPQQMMPQPPQFPMQQQAPATPMPAGSLDDYYSQPATGGGPSLKFNQKPVGTSYTFIVARKVTDADVRPQTNNQGVPQTYKDGRPKLVLVVPVVLQHPEYPEGRATWWVKGQGRDELARAMAEAGAPAGPPEEGAAIEVTLTGHRQIPNMNPQLLYGIRYQRPQNASTAQAPVEQPGPPAEVTPQPAAQPSQVAQSQPVAQAPTASPSAPQAPSALTDEQAQLLAQLTGQPQ